ncbi:uncharacterized protein LOC128189756 isoform X1 [Crassostrea angulata]|uniref:uncharacterized protein LOC128189756 isoform X1 n=1 Tax=Magallana angulata TaxID=2784310 RepID=UPI0022B21146|nr:uncharacterized protein LOC128189756 isoform X1 [Crassostrea angulata]
MTTHAQMREGFGTATFDESHYYTESRKFGGVISNRMSVYIDKTPHTAVIRFTNNSLLGEKLDVDKLNSRENSATRSDTGNNIINKIDSHLRLLAADSNLRPTSSGISDKIDLGATQASSPQNDGERGTEDVHLQQIECNNISSKSSSRKEVKKIPKTLQKVSKKRKAGKRKKRGKSGRASRNKSKQGKDGRVSKQCTPMATKVKPRVIQNDVQDIGSGVAGMGVLESMCKPMVLHKTAERKHSEKRETKLVSIVNRQTTQVSTKQIILPQMTNNFMVKSDVKERTSGQDSLQSSKSFVYPPSRVNHTDISRITKIYLSEKQSGVVRDCGMDVPCAPPATPLPDPSKKVEYIPCMNDIRSQRAVKVKLQVLEKEAQRKSARRRDDHAKQEKLQQKEREKDLRVKQRMEIYALNKIMTDLENKRFREFCEKKGISIT